MVRFSGRVQIAAEQIKSWKIPSVVARQQAQAHHDLSASLARDDAWCAPSSAMLVGASLPRAPRYTLAMNRAVLLFFVLVMLPAILWVVFKVRKRL